MSTLKPEEHEQLSNEQIRGSKAQHAYDEFIKNFIETKQKILFENFCAVALTDTESLMEIKRMSFAVDQLDSEIKTVIETGKMASIVLTKEEVKH